MQQIVHHGPCVCWQIGCPTSGELEDEFRVFGVLGRSSFVELVFCFRMIVCLDLHFCYISCMMFCDIFVSSALIVLFDRKIKYFDYCVFMCHKFDFASI
jgi:hypothetical protein